MPLYYFIFDSDHGPDDPDGVYCADLAEARDEAAKTLGAMISDAGAGLWKHEEQSLTVTDERGMILFRIVVATYETAATQPGAHSNIRLVPKV